jgi:hypothetical protein
MPGSAFELVVTVGRGDEADREDIEQLAYLLSDELRELNSVESIELLHEEAPQGAMGSGVLTGGMRIELAGPTGIPSLIDTIETWLSRDKERTLVMSLGEKNFQFPGLSKKEIMELAQWFSSQSG